MILEPKVERWIVAVGSGRTLRQTPLEACNQLELWLQKHMQTHDVYFPPHWRREVLGPRHVLGAMCVGPPLPKASDRYPAYVNWWPVDERTGR